MDSYVDHFRESFHFCDERHQTPCTISLSSAYLDVRDVHHYLTSGAAAKNDSVLSGEKTWGPVGMVEQLRYQRRSLPFLLCKKCVSLFLCQVPSVPFPIHAARYRLRLWVLIGDKI